MKTQVFAYAKVNDPKARQTVYEEIKRGKSRFGMWTQTASLREKWFGANMALLKIKKGDWIVHVNSPQYGHCVAVQAIGEYSFDDGIEVNWTTAMGNRDFNNFIPVDPSSTVEFDRNDPNIMPSVNLAPRRRIQRILAVEDFLESIDNKRNNRIAEYAEGLRGVAHIRSKMDRDILPQITHLIHKMNRSKDFEKFLHYIFNKMPNVLSIRNGFGWRPDHGADLIVEFGNPILGIDLKSKLIVQAKSYEGKHFDLNAVDQIVEGIQEYDADGGLLITTAENTEALEDKIIEASEKINKVINVFAGSDVARFVLSHSPDLLLGISGKTLSNS
jgi:hypothetical protein